MFRALKLKVDHVKWPRPFQVTVCLVYAGTCYNQFANKIWSVNYERILVKNRCVWKGSVGPPTTVDWNCDRLPSFEHTRKVQSIASVQNSSSDKVTCGGYTVKPFKLAALKAGDVTRKFVLAHCILVKWNHTILRQHTKSNKFGILLIFGLLNFVVLFSWRNLRNNGYANIKGFTVCSRFGNIRYTVSM